MHLKDAMRGREVSKRWRLAERWYGASPEARLALRGTLPLVSLPSDASQSSSQPPGAAGETAAEPRSGAAEGGREQPAYPMPALGSPRAWTGPRERAPSPLVFACSMTDTGEPARDVKESGEEAGESRTAISEALQAVRLGLGVGVWESPRHGEGPEGEGRETVQRDPGNAQAVHHGCGGILAKWKSPSMSLSREPCAVKVACTVLTGGCDMKSS